MSSPPITDVSEDALAKLNAAQREAVLHFEGPILVLAGAGSGKTRVLTTRIARLIEHHEVKPSQILAVTFTNKAAGEMKERIAKLIGETPAGMWVGTFHAIGARMLRREAQLVGRTSGFTIYDEDDSLAVVRRIMERLKISPKEWTPKALRSAISGAKNALVTPEEYAKLAMDPLSKAASLVYDQLEPTLRESNAVDFDDLLVLPVRVLQKNPDRVATYRRQFRFLLVDEYQDTNRAQYEFVKLMAGGDGNVLVVGDDDQSIYGWRGADIRNILDFERDFPTAAVVRLEDNYRSTPQVLALANAVISENTGRRGKTLRATLPSGDAVTQVATLDERDEAEFVADEIIVLGSGRRALAYRDIAILYRTNAQSRPLEESFRKRQIPYKLIGAVRFYDRREIRDLMSYLKLIGNPADNEAFLRAVSVPRRGLGDTTLDQLQNIAREAGRPLLEIAGEPARLTPLRAAARQALADFSALVGRYQVAATDAAVDELLRNLVTEIRFDDHLKAEGPEARDRLDNVQSLIDAAADTVEDDGGEVGLTPLAHFLQRAALNSEEQQKAGADSVSMMTLHNAKGLEFPAVFITGLEDGLFPLRRAQDEPEMMEEERRLFYVGITRAMRTLYLSHARSRRRNGETLQSIPSSFLKPIPAEMVTQRGSFKLRGSTRAVVTFSQAPSIRRPGQPVQRASWVDDVEVSQDAPSFFKGERIRHARFGSGTVAELSGSARDAKLTVDFDDTEIGRKRFVLAHAQFERGFE